MLRPCDDEGHDDVGSHAVGVGLLVGRVLALRAEVATQEQRLLAGTPAPRGCPRRHLEADREVRRGEGGLEDEEPQDVALRVVEEDRRPVEGNDPAQGLGDGVEEGVVGQVRHEGVVDLEQGAVARGLVGAGGAGSLGGIGLGAIWWAILAAPGPEVVKSM